MLNQSEHIPAHVDLREQSKKDVLALRGFLKAAETSPSDPAPLKFYKTHPSLSKFCGLALGVVRMLLSIPGGESHCERVFSWAGDFVTKKRNRTGNELLEMQMVLYDLFLSPGFKWSKFVIELEESGLLIPFLKVLDANN